MDEKRAERRQRHPAKNEQLVEPVPLGEAPPLRMVVDAVYHSPGLGGYRYRGTGRRVVGPYGGIVAVYHPPGLGGYRPLIRQLR